MKLPDWTRSNAKIHEKRERGREKKNAHEMRFIRVSFCFTDRTKLTEYVLKVYVFKNISIYATNVKFEQAKKKKINKNQQTRSRGFYRQTWTLNFCSLNAHPLNDEHCRRNVKTKKKKKSATYSFTSRHWNEQQREAATTKKKRT